MLRSLTRTMAVRSRLSHTVCRTRHLSVVRPPSPPGEQAPSLGVPTETTGDVWLRRLGWLGGFYREKQVLQRSAFKMYELCAQQATRQEFYDICQLPDTFQSWFLVVQLHVWMCLVRLRHEGPRGKTAQKQLVTFMWEDVENRIRLLRIDDRAVVQETTKELLSQFYGLLFAYDEGLVADDAVLASALWRNLYGSTQSPSEMQDVAALLAYVRREVLALDRTPSDDLLDKGKLHFGAPPLPLVPPPRA